MQQEKLDSNDLTVNTSVMALLMASARWARFLSIVGFVMVLLLLVSAMVLPGMMATNTYSDLDGTLTQDYTAAGVRVNFIILAVLLFFPCLYLFRFAVRMKQALLGLHQDEFEESFRNLKSTFKFFGILTIVVMGIYALAFVMWLVLTALQV